MGFLDLCFDSGLFLCFGSVFDLDGFWFWLCICLCICLDFCLDLVCFVFVFLLLVGFATVSV